MDIITLTLANQKASKQISVGIKNVVFVNPNIFKFTLSDNSVQNVTVANFNNYTPTEKTKLANLDETILSKFSVVGGKLLFDNSPIQGGTVDLTNYYNKNEINNLLGNKTDKLYVDTQDETKANLVHTHTISNVTNLQSELDNRYTKLECLSKTEVQALINSISKGMNWKESVTNIEDLPTTGNTTTDTRIVTSTTTINVWNGITWVAIGSSANIPMATSTINGQMSMEDKAKLDSIVLTNLVTTTGGNIIVDGDILPTTNGVQNIGSPTNRFKTIYVNEAKLSTNTLYIGDTPVLGTTDNTIMVKADKDQSLVVKTTGIGTTKVISESGVELSTSGMNANVNVQATGSGANANLSATNEVNLTAPNVNIHGVINASGDTTVGNLTVGGNLVINGSSFTVESTTVRIEDNIIELNKNEVGTGVTAGRAGLKINRGDADAYLMVFDETDDSFKVGTDTVLKPIALKEYVDTSVSNKLTSNNVKAGSNVTITTNGNDVTINSVGGTGTLTYFAEEW